MCTNTEGSYLCTCGGGFTLDQDGKRCNGMVGLSVLNTQYILREQNTLTAAERNFAPRDFKPQFWDEL